METTKRKRAKKAAKKRVRHGNLPTVKTLGEGEGYTPVETWEVTRTDPSAVLVTIPMGWTQRARILLSSCRHCESDYSCPDMQRRHLREAEQVGAGVVDLGDLMDLMEGRGDPRAKLTRERLEGALAAYKAAQREKCERPVDAYGNSVLRYAAEAYTPFAKHWLVQLRGNHEYSFHKHYGVDLTEWWEEKMRAAGSRVQTLGYEGWLRLRFVCGGTQTKAVTIRLMHGSGGGAIMTGGALKHKRRQGTFPDADMIASGHLHNWMWRMIGRERLTATGRVTFDRMDHLHVPSYKDTRRQDEGWGVMKEMDPMPPGAIWLEFEWLSELGEATDSGNGRRVIRWRWWAAE